MKQAEEAAALAKQEAAALVKQAEEAAALAKQEAAALAEEAAALAKQETATLVEQAEEEEALAKAALQEVTKGAAMWKGRYKSSYVEIDMLQSLLRATEANLHNLLILHLRQVSS